MQKIGFCDRYGLTQAVLNGTKTMTRRVEKGLENLEEGNFCYSKHNNGILLYGEKGSVIETIKTHYKLNETVAVAQSYYDVYAERQVNGSFYEWCISHHLDHKKEIHNMEELQKKKGWNNKLFVSPTEMPHRIQITGVRIERLQAISNDDCLKEGVTYDSRHWVNGYKVAGLWNKYLQQSHWRSPREAFAALINRPGVGRKGLWESNPWVVVYEFKLVK